MRYLLSCVVCGKEQKSDHHGRCSCGGMVDVFYDLESIENFVDRKRRGIWRYWKLLPVNPPNPSLPQGDITPLFRSRGLGEVLGLKNLWIKDESKNPTKTFKFREAVVTIARFLDLGVREFVLCSTGNTAAAFSYVASMTDSLTTNLLVPRAAKVRIDFPIPPNVKAAYIDGDYHEICDLAPRFASENRILWEGGFGNFCRREGLKTIALEVAEEGLQPDWYIQAVGSGIGPYGVFKGFSELIELGVAERAPKMLCVQPEMCSPMVRAFKDGKEEFPPEYTVKRSKTLVTTLIQGRPIFPYPYVRKTVLRSGGSMESVSEEEIRGAQDLMARHEDLSCEPAAATALAGLIKNVEEGLVDRSDVILLNHSGGVRDGDPVELPFFTLTTPVKDIYEGMK